MIYDKNQQRFLLGRQLGSTSFSATFEAVDNDSGAKVQLTIGKNGITGREVSAEIKALRALQGCDGVPKLIWSGEFEGQCGFAVNELGLTLGSLVRMRWLLPVGAILKIGVDLIRTLQKVHERGYVHLGVHPDNVHLSTTGEDVTLSGFYAAQKLTTNTPPAPPPQDYVFASSHHLAHARPSPRDDIESLSYLLSYAQTGNLPWSSAHTPEGVLLIRSKPAGKQFMSALPIEFSHFHAYVLALKSDSRPKYHMLRKKLREAAQRLGENLSISGLWVRKHYSRKGSEESTEEPQLGETARGEMPEINREIARKTAEKEEGDGGEKVQIQREQVGKSIQSQGREMRETLKISDELQRCVTLKALKLPSLTTALRSKRTV